MKTILVLATILTATITFAQKQKATTQTTTQTTTTTTSNYSASAGNNEMTANVGFASSALNIGVTYAKMTGSTGFGGYFQLQTEKDKVVNQAVALGALYKINVIDTAKAVFYAAPGFGLAMIKVPSTTATGSDDKTIFGPSVKIGAQLKLSPTFALGVERGLVTNWFEEKAGDSFELTTIAMSFAY